MLGIRFWLEIECCRCPGTRHLGIIEKWDYHDTKVVIVLMYYIDSLDFMREFNSLIILVGSLKSRLFSVRWAKSGNLSTFSTDSPGELDILGHDGDSLGVDGAQVGVLKETNQVGLASLLQSHNSAGLESEISLEVLGDFSDQTLEGQLADQKLCGFLVTSDLTESNSTGPVSVGLLNSTSGRGRFSGSFSGQLFTGSFSTGGFPGCLLGTGHIEWIDST